jgi:hypothetical protein
MNNKKIFPAFVAIGFLIGIICGMICSTIIRPARADSPSDPSDVHGIRLALEDIAKSQKKLADCKK